MLAKRLLLGPLIVLVAWMIMAFFVVRDYSTTKKKLQLTLGSIGEPDTLNPILSQSVSASEVGAFMFNALLTTDEHHNPKVDVAKEYRMWQRSTAFFATAKAASKALAKLQAAKSKWPAFKLTSCGGKGRHLLLEFSDPNSLVVAGTGYEAELFKIIDANRLLKVSVVTVSHNPTAKLSDGSEATTETVKAQLMALAESLEDAFIHEMFPINDSLLSVTVVGSVAKFRQAVPATLAGDEKPAGEVMEYFDQALLNEPVLEFKLRKDVRWHDGQPLTSADAVFTYRALVDPKYRSPRASSYWLIKGVEASDPYTFIVTYRVPYTDCLVSSAIPLIPSHILGGKSSQWWADNYNSKPIGTGPFRLVEWKRNEYVHLEANPDYFEGPPNLPAVVYRVVPDSFVNEIAFQQNGFDTGQLLFHQVARYQRQTRRFKLFRRWSRGYLYIGWNMKRPIFADRRVRQALAHAVNIEQIIEYVYYGWARPCTGPIPNVYWWSNPDIKPYPYDPDKARAMLAEAGWEDSDGDGYLDKDGKRFEFSLITNHGNVMRALIQLLVQDDLKKIGIKVNTAVYEWAVFINNYLKTQQFDAVVLGWFIPHTYDRYQLWHSSQAEPPGLNFCSYENPQVDRIVETIRTTFEEDKISTLSRKLEEIIYRDQPYLFLLEGMPSHALYRDRYVVHRPEDGKWITEEVRNTDAGHDGYDFYMPWWASKTAFAALMP